MFAETIPIHPSPTVCSRFSAGPIHGARAFESQFQIAGRRVKLLHCRCRCSRLAVSTASAVKCYLVLVISIIVGRFWSANFFALEFDLPYARLAPAADIIGYLYEVQDILLSGYQHATGVSRLHKIRT
jgi:hypothetical protein